MSLTSRPQAYMRLAVTYIVNCFSKLTLVISWYIANVTTLVWEHVIKASRETTTHLPTYIHRARRFTHKVISKSNTEPTLLEISLIL